MVDRLTMGWQPPIACPDSRGKAAGLWEFFRLDPSTGLEGRSMATGITLEDIESELRAAVATVKDREEELASLRKKVEQLKVVRAYVEEKQNGGGFDYTEFAVSPALLAVAPDGESHSYSKLSYVEAAVKALERLGGEAKTAQIAKAMEDRGFEGSDDVTRTLYNVLYRESKDAKEPRVKKGERGSWFLPGFNSDNENQGGDLFRGA